MNLRVVTPVVFGVSLGLLSLTLWYGLLASLILPKMYRPLHHWMYGVAMMALGAWKHRKSYGKFFLAMGAILLWDDFHDLVQALSITVGF